MLSDVSGVDACSIYVAPGKIEKCARLERDQDPIVDQAYIVDDAPCFLERFEVGVIQKNRRKADQK